MDVSVTRRGDSRERIVLRRGPQSARWESVHLYKWAGVHRHHL